MKVAADGWHTCYGYRIYTEGNKVLRGVEGEYLGTHTVYPYRRDRNHRNLWDCIAGCTYQAFKAGVKRGTIKMF